MSLGPPFDSSGLKLQQAVGAGGRPSSCSAAVAWVLLDVGPHRRARRDDPGGDEDRRACFTVAARCGLAGREIGEIRGMVAGRDHHVEIEAFVLRSFC